MEYIEEAVDYVSLGYFNHVFAVSVRILAITEFKVAL